MTLRFEDLVANLGAQSRAARAQETVEVDLTDLLGEGAVFVYRAPSLADLYAVADARVLSEWRKQYPELPDPLIVQLELYARLHRAPPSNEPTGKLYAELALHAPPAVGLAVLRRIERALSAAYQLDDLEGQIEEKKARSRRAKTR